jgi:hypothetical protein
VCSTLCLGISPLLLVADTCSSQVALLTETWIHREFGFFKKRWVATEDDSMNYPYRPVSYLRLAVAGFRNFGLKGVPKSPPPFVRITLLPEGDNSGKIATASPLQEYHIATFSTSLDRHGSLPLCPPDLASPGHRRHDSP